MIFEHDYDEPAGRASSMAKGGREEQISITSESLSITGGPASTGVRRNPRLAGSPTNVCRYRIYHFTRFMSAQQTVMRLP